MSYFIVGVLVPGYEDYDQYGCKGNAFAGFPQLWPAEQAAESGIYREWKKMRDLGAAMRRAAHLSILWHPEPQSIVERALVSIAREEGWRVANPLAVEHYGVRVIYAIPPEEETEDVKPTRWNDIVRWMDQAQTKRERLAELEKKNTPRPAKAKGFQIDSQRLAEMMGDMMPSCCLPKGHEQRCNSIVEEALVSIAQEGGWRIANSDAAERYGVSVIYKIS